VARKPRRRHELASQQRLAAWPRRMQNGRARGAGDRGDAGCEPVEAVDQVERVGEPTIQSQVMGHAAMPSSMVVPPSVTRSMSRPEAITTAAARVSTASFTRAAAA